MEHHAPTSSAESLPRHVPDGIDHAYQRSDDSVAREIRFWRARVSLCPLGTLVGRHYSVCAVLLGCHIRHVSLPAQDIKRFPPHLACPQDHPTATLAPRDVRTLATPRHHPRRSVLRRCRASTSTNSTHHNRRANDSRKHSMHALSRSRTSKRNTSDIPLPTNSARFPFGKRRRLIGVRTARTNGPIGRSGAIARRGCAHANTSFREQLAVLS